MRRDRPLAMPEMWCDLRPWASRTREQNSEGRVVGAADPAGEELATIEQRIRPLHDRLLAGDRVASEEVAPLVLGPVLTRLERRWPRWTHTDVLYDAAVDALLDYADAPERYDPDRGSLIGWLELAAHRDVTNGYRSAKQRTAHDTPPLSAIQDPDQITGELPIGASPLGLARIGPEPDDVSRLDDLDIWHRIRAACPDERERELIWACWVEHERSSDRLAQILRVDHLPVDKRRRKVKDARDVAKRKLRRIGLIDDGHD